MDLPFGAGESLTIVLLGDIASAKLRNPFGWLVATAFETLPCTTVAAFEGFFEAFWSAKGDLEVLRTILRGSCVLVIGDIVESLVVVILEASTMARLIDGPVRGKVRCKS